MKDNKHLPSYAYLPPEDVQGYAELTERGTYSLLPGELPWKDRYAEVKAQGYLLRQRYHPDWTPSWTGTNLDPTYCEDSVRLERPHVIDAIRILDNFRVSLKLTKRDGREIDIHRYVTSLEAPHNHCIPLLDVFSDPINPQSSIIVTPFLRPMNDPPFTAMGEVIDFIDQTLKGLIFLHKHRVAHRDIAAPNIMMDGRSLYLHGHHPVRLHYAPDNVYDASPLARIDHPVRYFYIDFGISRHFAEGSQPMAVGREGRNLTIPELSSTVPYNAYKIDVFALGDVYSKEFMEKYYDLDDLVPLLEAMRRPDPSQRVSAEEAFSMFQEIRSHYNDISLRWRLRARSESAPERMVYDAVTVALEGYYQLKRLVR
ncbi:kinase-like domain-containing protein [Daedaleopsis nitida]|nr:kinase-like domain-containing protein [Daedaleopsis nitida]